MSSTTIRSARVTVDSRCATTSTVIVLAAVVIVAAGVVIGPADEQSIKIALNTRAMLCMAEIVLTVPLFVDATVLPFALKACRC